VANDPVRVTAPLLDVLETLIAAHGHELHGWAIMKTSGRTGPTVYKVLDRLAALGWLSARWEDQVAEPNRPRRRFDRLTSDCAAKAAELLAARRPQPHKAATLRLAFGSEQ
jgi:PadR family transcriptional regulator PadR